MMDLIVKGWDEETKTMLPEVDLSSPRKCWPEWFGNKDVTLLLFTNKKDKEENELFAGDIITALDGKTLMVIKFGKYQAYCPVDEAYMENVGFYVEFARKFKSHYVQMPLGPTEEYAIKKGNVFETPELLKAGESS